MMTVTVLGGLAAAAVAACGLGEWLEGRRAARRREAAIHAWRGLDPIVRQEHLKALTSTHASNALAWYLRGCEAFRSHDLSDAARFFGMAHHLDPNFISAALLTFTALKSASTDTGNSDRWLRELVETWREMKLPPTAIDGGADATVLLEIDTRNAPEALSSLGRLAWLIKGSTDGPAIRELIEDRPAWAAPLFRN